MPAKPSEPIPTVLLVDGDEIQSLMSKRELESEGYRVVCVHSGEDAIAAFEQEKIDAVVADALLPDMHVLDLIDGIAAKRRRIPIVVNSPHTVCNHNFRYWAADAIVEKSSDMHKLFAQVAALL
ncbi:response regulator [candidate division KSB1 bacterium]|nr:response regulator [candidate division KSB1 bacterium]